MRVGFKPYPAYKDSCVEWLGKIPQEWEVKRLKHLCKRSAVYGANEPSANYANTGVRFLRTTDLTDVGSLNSDGAVFLEPAAVSEYLLEDGDLLLSRSGTLGRSLVFQKSLHGECAYAGYLVKFSFRGHCLPQFVFYFTKSQAFSDWLSVSAIESTIGNINGQKYANLPTPSPSFEEQKAIASFLDGETAKIDTLLQKKERLIVLLQEKRTALISHAVTQGLNPDVPKKDCGISWIGKIPEHWELTRLGRKIELQRGVDITKEDQNEGSVPVVSSSGVSSFHDKALARGPGVIVGRKGTAGAVHYVESDYWPHDTTLYVREFRGNNPRFVFYKLCSMDLASFDTGTANPTLNRNLVHPVFVSWPPCSEQVGIASRLDQETAKLDCLVAKVRVAIERLQEYRTALISATVTGQIDLRTKVA